MNILVTPNFQIVNTNNNNKQKFLPLRSFNMPKYNNTLVKDTVSFSGKTSIIGNAIEQSYLSRVEKFIDYAKNFHNALKNACDELADLGFTYDEVYNSKHPIKSFDSYVDKYERQGYVQDTVRGTVYWTDPSNIGSFKKFLEVMKEKGYEPAVIRVLNQKTGKLDKLPDLEIRQNGISKEDLAPLGPFLQKSEISKPRSSTYADYQMRFVPISKKGKNENKQTLELIMLYGPHYAKAKELESKYVYNIARSFDKLHIDTKTKYAENTPGRRISNNIDVIKTRLREDISKPLFMNAYNADLKVKGEEKLPIVISKVHAKMLDGYMSGIRQKIPMYYKEMKQKIQSDEYIISLIKNSSNYEIREDKTITPEEIIRYREFFKARLEVMESDDISNIAKTQEMLKETLSKYAEK